MIRAMHVAKSESIMDSLFFSTYMAWVCGTRGAADRQPAQLLPEPTQSPRARTRHTARSTHIDLLKKEGEFIDLHWISWLGRP